MTAAKQTSAPRPGSAAPRALLWLVTLGCFAFLYFLRIGPAASARGLSVPTYLAGVLETVRWGAWLPIMAGYSLFFFLIDSLVVWRTINWFNARIPYTGILPIRASAYIISILNEQVGKGVMAVYLNRRDRVPGWQVGSSMLFIMFCEVYYLLSWAALGVALRWDRVPELHPVPAITAAALVVFVVWVLYFRGVIGPASAARDREILHAFRQARWWQYFVVILLRSPALLAAIWVYWLALGCFGIEAEPMDLIAYLPVIFASAALPLPLRAGPIVMWELIYPGDPGRVTTFALLQHNFFIFFNAAIGLLFLRRANREIFGPGRDA